MKNRNIKIILLVTVIFLLPFLSWSYWYIEDAKELNVLIIDKTVLNTSVQEHSSLIWILNNEKYGNKKLELLEPAKDYYGFFPDDEGGYEINDFNYFSKDEIDSLSKSYDMVYYTDLYGIYKAEWYEVYPHVAPKEYNKIPATERSPLIYGGLTKKELNLLVKMKDQKKLIITEFNIIASPTRYNIRKKFEREFGVKWSNWVGRYFASLDTTKNKEIPRWLKDNYLEQNNNNWPFTKSGIVFVRNDDRIVILENETDLEVEVPIIYTPRLQQDIYNLPNEMKYPFWFDIVYADEMDMLISYYKIHSNHRGDSTLTANGIPNAFPAVLQSKGNYPFYYFAGDFADNPVSMAYSKFKKSNWISDFTYKSTTEERNSFFWDYYRPLIATILDNYYSSINRNKDAR